MDTRRERAQSVSVNYTLSLVIVIVLITGIFVSMSGFLETERERTTRSEFEVLGNRIAADLAAADRLASTTEGDAARVEIRTTIPRSVAGSEYEVSVDATDQGDYYKVDLTLTAADYGVSKTVTVRTANEVTGSTITGGKYVVVFDGGTLEVRNA